MRREGVSFPNPSINQFVGCADKLKAQVLHENGHFPNNRQIIQLFWSKFLHAFLSFLLHNHSDLLNPPTLWYVLFRALLSDKYKRKTCLFQIFHYLKILQNSVEFDYFLPHLKDFPLPKRVL